jgi:hypothetical protein
VINYKILSPSLRLTYDNLKAQTKIPLWTFSGLGVLALIIIAVTISSQKKLKKVNEMVLTPKTNDIVEIKQKDGSYTLLKINSVTSDSIYFFANKYQTDRAGALSELDGKSYDTITYSISRTMLIDMNKKDEVVDMVRN